MKKLILTLLLCSLQQTLWAQSAVFGQPATGGSGCPGGQALVKVEKTGLVTIQYGELNVGDNLGEMSFRKTCALRLPVSLPAKKQLVIRQIVSDLEFFTLPGDQIQVEQRIGVVGLLNPSPSKKWMAPITNGSLVQTRIGQLPAGQFEVISPCSTGRDLMITADVNIMSRQMNLLGSVKINRSLFVVRVVNCK